VAWAGQQVLLLLLLLLLLAVLVVDQQAANHQQRQLVQVLAAMVAVQLWCCIMVGQVRMHILIQCMSSLVSCVIGPMFMD
jgi:hypothetical protein